jgi:hypothetical protein
MSDWKAVVEIMGERRKLFSKIEVPAIPKSK